MYGLFCCPEYLPRRSAFGQWQTQSLSLCDQETDHQVKQWLDRLYRAIETTDLDVADIAPRIAQ